MPKHVYLRRSYRLFFTIFNFRYFRYNDILHTLNVYKIIAKDQQVVDSWTGDEIPVSEILFWKYFKYVPLIFSNYKKLKTTKMAGFTISCFLDAQEILKDNSRIIFRKTKCPMIVRFLYKFLYRVQNTSP